MRVEQDTDVKQKSNAFDLFPTIRARERRKNAPAQRWL